MVFPLRQPGAARSLAPLLLADPALGPTARSPAVEDVVLVLLAQGAAQAAPRAVLELHTRQITTVKILLR